MMVTTPCRYRPWGYNIYLCGKTYKNGDSLIVQTKSRKQFHVLVKLGMLRVRYSIKTVPKSEVLFAKHDKTNWHIEELLSGYML